MAQEGGQAGNKGKGAVTLATRWRPARAWLSFGRLPPGVTQKASLQAESNALNNG